MWFDWNNCCLNDSFRVCSRRDAQIEEAEFGVAAIHEIYRSLVGADRLLANQRVNVATPRLYSMFVTASQDSSLRTGTLRASDPAAR